jgi:hypothetical protein
MRRGGPVEWPTGAVLCFKQVNLLHDLRLFDLKTQNANYVTLGLSLAKLNTLSVSENRNNTPTSRYRRSKTPPNTSAKNKQSPKLGEFETKLPVHIILDGE